MSTKSNPLNNTSKNSLITPAITRFAPSPTGYIHIGNVRSAIYPYLIAKQTNGRFILRIEDTDQARFVDGATDLIISTLKWLGLDWDEGVEVGGNFGPYIQSERKEHYLRWAKKLLDEGKAYADPTTSDQINTYREEAVKNKVPYLYRNYRPKNPPEWHEGMPIRFKTTPKSYSWHDEVMGDMHTGPEVLDDIIIIKADGLPTYNFAHIIDDMEMNITHVIRGVEYLTSTPNYLALYEALNIPVPKLVSLPHILGPTGGKKLSKRDGAKSVIDYKNDGILPEAMLNYLACLGWNDGTEQEIFSKSDLIEKFSIDRIQNSGARFDETKLLWQNGQWIRKIAAEEGIENLYKRTLGFWPETTANSTDNYQIQVLSIVYDRLKTLSDLRTMTAYFFSEPTIDISQITSSKFLKKFTTKQLQDFLNTTITSLEKITNWSADNIQNSLNALLAETELKPAELFTLIRISVSFASFSPALHLTLEVLGKDTSINRLKRVSEQLS